jgi:preprotein translocase subunit SecD
MKILSVILLTIFFSLFAFATKAMKLEYRLVAKSGGQEFKWSRQVAGGQNAKPKFLDSQPFFSNADFSSFVIKAAKSPPNALNTYEVELRHSTNGRKKFAEIANQDRDRTYCVVIGNEIYQCLTFTPEVKGLWDQSTPIYGPFSKDQAQKLVNELNGDYEK